MAQIQRISEKVLNLNIARILLIRSDLEMKRKRYDNAIILLEVLLLMFPNNEEAQSKLATVNALKKNSLKRKRERGSTHGTFGQAFGGVRSILKYHPTYLKNLEKVLDAIGKVPKEPQADEIITFLTIPSVSIEQKNRIIKDIKSGTTIREIAKTYGITRACVRAQLRELEVGIPKHSRRLFRFKPDTNAD